MFNLDPVTERGLIVAALSAGTIWGVLKTTVPSLKRQIRELAEKHDRLQRTVDRLAMAHKIHHKENVNGNDA